MNNPVIWTTIVEYYDMISGEQITKYQATTKYIVVKTNTKIELNEIKTRGIKRIYKLCTFNPQLKLKL